MTNKKRSKNCEKCGTEFFERRSDSNSQWALRSFCSMKCNNSSKRRVTCIFERLERFQIKKTGCWGWSGGTDGHGYGALSNRDRGKNSPEKAHRVSYEKEFGPIPAGKVVRHKCDNPSCTNPDHLRS